MALVTANVTVGIGIMIVVEGEEVVGDVGVGVGVEDGMAGISGTRGVLDGLEMTIVIHPDMQAIVITKVITRIIRPL